MMDRMKQVQPVSEPDLLDALRRGDEEPLRVLYRKHYPMIINLVVNNGGSLQEGKDIHQETLIAFYERVREPGFRLECSIKTFLYSVARRLWLKQLQRRQRFGGTLNDAEVYVEVEMELIERREAGFRAMYEALEAMGEPCRSILKDFYLAERSMDEIARKFGYTNTDNAKTQKYKCLQRLKKRFFASMPGQNE